MKRGPGAGSRVKKGDDSDEEEGEGVDGPGISASQVRMCLRQRLQLC